MHRVLNWGARRPMEVSAIVYRSGTKHLKEAGNLISHSVEAKHRGVGCQAGAGLRRVHLPSLFRVDTSRVNGVAGHLGIRPS